MTRPEPARPEPALPPTFGVATEAMLAELRCRRENARVAEEIRAGRWPVVEGKR